MKKQPKLKLKQISYSDRLRAFALFTIANRYYIEARKFEDEMHDVLGLETGTGSWFSDCIFDDKPDFNKALVKEGFVVRK